MSQAVAFAHAYRQLGRPALKTGNSFSFSIDAYDEVVNGAIQSLENSKAGRFDELLIDQQEIHASKVDFSRRWGTAELTFSLDTSGSVSVFRSFDQLMVRSKSLVRNQLPDHFYIVDDDVLSSENPVDTRVKSLQSLCRVMGYLADLANFHDEKNSSDEYKLVFVTEDKAYGDRAITLIPYLDHELLTCEVGTDLLDSLQDGNLDSNPHLLKERSVFRSSLIEYLAGHEEGRARFRALVMTWTQFRALYENNLATYLSGFSFHKAKQEIATAQLAIADQMSKIVSDISGKVLSVPISLVVTIAISKADNVLESSILVLGVTVASALLAETLAAQKLQYERVKHSRVIMFSSHELKLHQYPPDLREHISKATVGLSSNETKLRASLVLLRAVSWMPAIVAVALHSYLYRTELEGSLVKLWQVGVGLMSFLAESL